MRKWVNLVILAVLVSFSSGLAQSCLANARANGLTVGTSPDYPPFESLDKNNKIVGFDVDLLNAIGAELGLKVKFVGQSFDGLIPALLSKKIDVIAAGLTITEERKKSVDFSRPYISGPNVIITRKETTGINKLEDLVGKKVAVQIGSAQEKIASGVKGAEVKSYNLYTDAALAVNTRQADALIVHRFVGRAFLKQYPDLKIVAELNQVDTGLALRKDCGDLRRAIDTAIEKLEKNGKMEELAAKWFK
ncbi:MAG: basic amino acid ABC transporter substrate-binding protein [Meiothermus sp.]|uniref:basic amino acid ABC transporter substrate-binding protein n=1 Tax=Meiothermus sp. TaxID=1955249 RepID=UPI0025DA5DD6|nr:basic amino acid ABC transporter substrate-binding protein [Meiothermus sp.]MCS7069349.1 basic amino acid ABC transporter substrate-binding protein [Meiothermus sp.]MCX7601536.1 basic amino acid ABC transporter substrate-binding protein [Meiothermus sp.]MDW8424431.1 basic amino acid ABC transporter substrate-binding protein [Meiothermus sp.]